MNLDKRIPLRDPQPAPRDNMPLIAWTIFILFLAYTIHTVAKHP